MLEGLLMDKRRKTRSYSFWRKLHLYSFGYFTIPALIVSLILLLIGITGILYNHQHDFEFIEKTRVSTRFLPVSYQDRLDKTRQAQGLQDLFPEEADRVPLMWLIKDLHTGDFWGRWGRLFYDLVGLSLLMVTASGCYLFLKMKGRTKEKLRRK